MEICFHGHACVSLRAADGRVVVMDPYRPGAFDGRLAHGAVKLAADVVTVSHHHVDHAHVTADLSAPGGGLPPVVDRSGDAAGLSFAARFTYHDRFHGTRMGMNAMIAFELDGLRVVHLGDLGCPLTPDDVAALGAVDVLVLPVGGVYTLGPGDAPALLEALRPRVALPVHYDNARCHLGMAPIEALLPHLAAAPLRPGRSRWHSGQGLPDPGSVLILEPAC
ncbi:MAG: MBL fold metallo-hydrolase [Deltaproteobacteria bacterium]|nr:MBL fold metallo-hydrolase [Deltaproteobacteria bacterium]MCB9786998.1 MBL fold metallo-hydrolase [Deltaproteobacteria bacterium]